MLSSGDIPQWKKDLLHRRQCRNKTAPSVEQLLSTRAPLSGSVTVGRAGQQPSQTCNSSGAVAAVGTTTEVLARCNANTTHKYPVVANNIPNSKKMVQERTWTDHNPIKALHLVTQTKESEKNVDSDSSEELQYGPGIVSKLKNRYLNLTLRETSVRSRPSILHMRKATSLEHLIDDSDIEENQDEDDNAASDKPGKNANERLFAPKLNGTTKNIPNRYKGARFDMKRARSVETISIADDNCLHTLETRPKRESLHEEMLIKNEGNDKTDDKKMSEINDNKTFSNNIGLRLNRPKRIAPVMDEKEKPPLDVVRQTKKLFEKPELRTKPPACTGEVAAKVATYKNIISQTKANKKPPVLKQKPQFTTNNKKLAPITNGRNDPKMEAKTSLKTPETPDVTSTSLPSPIPDVSKVNEIHSPEFHHVNGYSTSSLSETPDLILHSSHSYAKSATYKDVTEDFLKAEISHSNKLTVETDDDESEGEKTISAEAQKNLGASGNSVVFNFATSQATHQNHLPNIQQKAQPQNNRVPLMQPLRIEIAGANNIENRFQTSTPTKHSPPSHFSPQFKKQVSPQIQQLSPKFTKTSPQKLPSPQSIKSPPQANKSSPNKSKPPLSPPPKLQPLPPSPKHHSKPPLSPPPKYHSKLPVSPPLKHSKPPLSPPPKLQPSIPQQSKKPNQPPALVILTPSVAAEQFEINERVIEKNLKNAAKNAEEKPGSERVQKIEVPRPRRTAKPKQEQNSLVFNFTNRKDVPDYVGNHGPIRTGKIERPKVGEGGITLLPGASLDESIVDDDDEELLRSLEGPPSPCNVTFINDNVLIDGKSSLSKKTKKPKMSIKFVDSGPDIYEYPSEASLLEDTQVPTTNSAPVGHSVPSLSGSSLATYTPKSTFPSEEFQLGVKPASSPPETKQAEVEPNEPSMHETEQPIMFSAGTNTDILF